MDTKRHNETLDPENWDEMRTLAHRMVDDAITYLETVGERPVWQPVPDDVARRFDEPAPHEPVGAEAVYQEFLEDRVSLSDGQYSSSLLGLVHGERNRVWGPR